MLNGPSGHSSCHESVKRLETRSTRELENSRTKKTKTKAAPARVSLPAHCLTIISLSLQLYEVCNTYAYGGMQLKDREEKVDF
jgi:hypothetical protein